VRLGPALLFIYEQPLFFCHVDLQWVESPLFKRAGGACPEQMIAKAIANISGHRFVVRSKLLTSVHLAFTHPRLPFD
jgi:hypothetical protein